MQGKLIPTQKMNYSDACLPCGNTCEQCRTNSDCLACFASSSSYFGIWGVCVMMGSFS